MRKKILEWIAFIFMIILLFPLLYMGWPALLIFHFCEDEINDSPSAHLGATIVAVFCTVVLALVNLFAIEYFLGIS